ncbi:MAG: 5'-deoxynucleotidase YfbR [Syntrophomonadaceae bacterium]|nr:5'-deoxynucleotidase YfbR [Bacillota bacterium]
MEDIINFLIEVSKLKEMPRTGWVLSKVKRPETIGEHIFRVAFASWLLAQKVKLNIKKAIKIALSHDLCEVYAGDVTPFFYYTQLPKKKEEREKMLMKWVRLSKKDKEKRGKMKFERERKALLKLIKSLEPKVKKDIFLSWFDYEKGISKEGKFVRQLDRIETLVQAIEYFGPKIKNSGTSWWEGTEEIVHDPLLLEFLEVIQKKFYGKIIRNHEGNKELEDILDFLLQIGRLKKMPRKGWVIREVKTPETIGGFVFMATLMAWIFAIEKNLRLNTEKLLKMALCHELSRVYASDETPYDRALGNKTKKEKRKILKKWIRFSKKEKMKIFLENYKKEKEALKKLVLGLPPDLKKEIIQLWHEFKNLSSPEAHFLAQLHILANLFQALQYWRKDKRFPIGAFWEWAFEVADSQMSFEFIGELKKKFYNKDINI